jgi:uncharacterized membrane protein YphA (DoxX/SURF4 family)
MYPLQRIFSTFPSGWPGAGLMVLRAAVSITLFAQGVGYLGDWREPAFMTWAVAVLALASGGLLLIGYLTPFASFLAGAIIVGSRFFWLQASSPKLFDSNLATALAASIAVAIVCLGPGAFSVDAHLFGRREIIIPDASHPGES